MTISSMPAVPPRHNPHNPIHTDLLPPPPRFVSQYMAPLQYTAPLYSDPLHPAPQQSTDLFASPAPFTSKYLDRRYREVQQPAISQELPLDRLTRTNQTIDDELRKAKAIYKAAREQTADPSVQRELAQTFHAASVAALAQKEVAQLTYARAPNTPERAREYKCVARPQNSACSYQELKAYVESLQDPQSPTATQPPEVQHSKRIQPHHLVSLDINTTGKRRRHISVEQPPSFSEAHELAYKKLSLHNAVASQLAELAAAQPPAKRPKRAPNRG